MKIAFECGECGDQSNELAEFLVCSKCRKTIRFARDEEKARLARDLADANVIIEDLRQSLNSSVAGYVRLLRRLEEFDPVFKYLAANAGEIPFEAGDEELENGRTSKTETESAEAS